MTGESRNDAFKKVTRYAAADPSEDRTGFHPSKHSPPSNATPLPPCRPHGHGHRIAPSHGLCPGAPRYHHQGRHPGIQDLDTTSSETRRYPSQRDEWKGRSFSHPWSAPRVETQRAGQNWPPSPVLLYRVQDKLGPAAGRETRSVLLPGARRGRSSCRAQEELCLAATGARRAMDRNWEWSSPMTRVEPGRRGEESKVKTGRSPTADAGGDQPPP